MSRIKVDCTGCSQFKQFHERDGFCAIGNLDAYGKVHGVLERYFVFCCIYNEGLKVENKSW